MGQGLDSVLPDSRSSMGRNAGYDSLLTREKQCVL